MKNVTITLKKEVDRWARLQAAATDVSVSRYLGGLLEDEMKRQQGYARAMRANVGREPVALKREGGDPSRDEIHDRSLLRRWRHPRLPPRRGGTRQTGRVSVQVLEEFYIARATSEGSPTADAG